MRLDRFSPAAASRYLPAVVDRLAAIPGAFWGLLDQALSSLSNFLLAIAVARQVSTESFGAFSLAFGAYVILLSVTRAAASDPFTIRYSASTPDRWRAGAAKATGLALMIGVVSAVGCAALGLMIGGEVGAVLIGLAVGLPVLMLQDAWRYVFFAGGRGRDAFLNDFVWTLVMAVGVFLLSVTGSGSAVAYILAWVAGSLAGAVFGIWQAGFLPQPLQFARWVREHLDIAPRLTIEALIVSGAQPLALTAVGVIVGVAAVGAVRGGQVLTNALHIATFGIYFAAVPEGVRLLRIGSGKLLRLCVVTASGLAALTAVWGAVLLILPDSLGRIVLGENWAPTQPVILPLVIGAAAAAVQVGAVIGLRALAMATRSLRTRIITSVMLLVGGILGAILGGAVGTAWGLALALILGIIPCWNELIRGLAEHDRRRTTLIAEPVGA